ncbi:GbsR/MarR family transcriptional regulator [Cystobacter fuscus]|uniref:GbsR/MarR family transcriptional regulator n=1 Tax=Cystobacter fuscus TaxID=43 RepID=UPI0005BC9258|nr:MarR family transcriptional regulator [Cystobacter fuscus]
MGKRAGAKRDEAAVGRFVERFALALSDDGFPRMPARVFVGLLVSEQETRTAAELAQQLRVSPAAISGAVRYLVQMGMVSREREPGQRSDHYRVSSNAWYEALARRDQMLLRFEQGLREGIDAVGAESLAGLRLEESRQFFEFVRGEMPRLLAQWREQRAATGRD